MTQLPGHEGWATGRLLSTAARLVEQTWNARLREHGISHAGAVVLATLSRGPASQRNLAVAHKVTEQTMARTVAHLEATGHARRLPDPTDRRRRSVEITGSGVDLIARLTDGGEQLTEEILRASGHDVAAFRTALSAIVTALGPPPRQGDPVAAVPIRAHR
jgi:MarR family transcriptional regulator, organic hydroperoxide resistance regulator